MSYLEFTTDDTTASGAVGNGYNVSGIAIKFVVEGGMLADMVDYEEYVNLVQVSGDGTDPFYVTLIVNNSSDPIEAEVAGGNRFGTLSITDFSAGSFYKFYVFADPTVPDLVFAIYDENDTELFRLDRQHFGALDIGANPSVSFGLVDDDDVLGTGPYARLDAVAFYDGHAPDETSEPSASDGGILGYWPINEGSGTTLGNEVSGGADLSIGGTEDTDWSWETGGIWDASGGGGTSAISGTSAGTSTDSAGPSVTDSLTATGAGLSTDTAGPSVTDSLTATGSGTSTDTVGSIILNLSGTATSAGTSSDTATPSVTDSISGTGAGTSTDTGAITTAGVQQLTGTLAGTSSDSAAVSATDSLSATGVGTSAATGAISATDALTATGTGISSDSAGISATDSLTATGAGVSTDSATASIMVGLTGTAAGTSVDSGALTGGVFLGLNIAVSVDQPLDLDADVDQPLDMDVDVEPQE